jgi:hypothetical protein
MLDGPAEISRIVFRHGVSSEQGGWFDTSQAKPRVEVVRTAPPYWEGTNHPDMSKATWEPVAQIDPYPASSASSMPDLKAGEAFEIRLPQPTEVYAIRVVGCPGGDHASCAELSAYA